MGVKLEDRIWTLMEKNGVMERKERDTGLDAMVISRLGQRLSCSSKEGLTSWLRFESGFQATARAPISQSRGLARIPLVEGRRDGKRV